MQIKLASGVAHWQLAVWPRSNITLSFDIYRERDGQPGKNYVVSVSETEKDVVRLCVTTELRLNPKYKGHLVSHVPLRHGDYKAKAFSLKKRMNWKKQVKTTDVNMSNTIEQAL